MRYIQLFFMYMLVRPHRWKYETDKINKDFEKRASYRRIKKESKRLNKKSNK